MGEGDETTMSARMRGLRNTLKFIFIIHHLWREIAQTLEKDETFLCACVLAILCTMVCWHVFAKKYNKKDGQHISTSFHCRKMKPKYPKYGIYFKT